MSTLIIFDGHIFCHSNVIIAYNHCLSFTVVVCILKISAVVVVMYFCICYLLKNTLLGGLPFWTLLWNKILFSKRTVLVYVTNSECVFQLVP